MRSAECGVRSAECGKCGVWKMRSLENAECGKCVVWKMPSVEIFYLICTSCTLIKRVFYNIVTHFVFAKQF